MNKDIVTDKPSRTSLPISPWRLALSAGLGSGFALLIVLGLQELYFKLARSDFSEVVAIFIVSVGVLMFVEPLLNQVKHVFGLSESEHFIARSPKWRLQVGGLIAIAGAGVSHAMLHDIVEKIKLKDALHVAFGTITPVATTRAWISQVQQRRPAAWTGGGVAALFGGAVALVNHYIKIRGVSEIMALVSAGLWGACGLVGGLALDRGWGSSATRGIVAAFVGVKPRLDRRYKPRRGNPARRRAAFRDEFELLIDQIVEVLMHGDGRSRNALSVNFDQTISHIGNKAKISEPANWDRLPRSHRSAFHSVE